MTCSVCGGQVEWQGHLTNLTHTQCQQCLLTNCQIVHEDCNDEDGEEE